MKFTRENNKRGFEEHKKYENVQGFFLESETGDNDGEKLTDDIKDNIMDNGIDIDREIACEKKKNRKRWKTRQKKKQGISQADRKRQLNLCYLIHILKILNQSKILSFYGKKYCLSVL